VDLAKNLLNNRTLGGTALVISTETITPNLYKGNEKGFLLQNTLFRCGGAAIVLSNKFSDGRRAKYKLLNTVRVQGTGPADYECVYETQVSARAERARGRSERKEELELPNEPPSFVRAERAERAGERVNNLLLFFSCDCVACAPTTSFSCAS
jgi:hypothetical protein